MLSRYGVSEEIAQALGETEKRDLAACLTRAFAPCPQSGVRQPQMRG